MTNRQAVQVVSLDPIPVRLKKPMLSVMADPHFGLVSRIVAINEANATAVDGRDCISFGEVVLSAVDTIRAADARDASVGSKFLAV